MWTFVLIIRYSLYNAFTHEKVQLVLPFKQTIKEALSALPAPFKDGNVVCFAAPRLEVDAGLESVLLKGLQNHTFCIDLCGEDDKSILLKDDKVRLPNALLRLTAVQCEFIKRPLLNYLNLLAYIAKIQHTLSGARLTSVLNSEVNFEIMQDDMYTVMEQRLHKSQYVFVLLLV